MPSLNSNTHQGIVKVRATGIKGAQRSWLMHRFRQPRTAVVPGTVLGLALVGLAAAVLLALRDQLSPATPALVLTLAVGASAYLGGARAAVLVAGVAALVLDVLFLPPYGHLRVLDVEDGVTLGAFLVVAGMVGVVVAAQGDRRREAERREAEMRALNDELQAAHRERALLSERAGQADDLARIDDQRSALLRSVSHDLRTPLSAIRAVATDLRSGVAYDEETRRELLTMVCDEVDRLDRLVANLLSLSRIEAGAFHPERQAVDMEELVADRVRRLAPLFTDLMLKTEVEADLPLVDGDYSQIEQVLDNLLANAARHAPTGSDVWVVVRPRAGSVQLEVSDRGKGVADEEKQRIFEPFQRGEGSGSSGIGLAICKAIAEAHGGSIKVDRTFGGGATFIVTLPEHRGSVLAQ
jgi:two-component system sensor histidine kinase KdpD